MALVDVLSSWKHAGCLLIVNLWLLVQYKLNLQQAVQHVLFILWLHKDYFVCYLLSSDGHSYNRKKVEGIACKEV
jgi:bacteriorhodopsin